MEGVVARGNRPLKTSRPHQDSELVDAARTGDRRAFGELVQRYQNAVCAVAYALTGNLHQSEEIAQEAFIAAWKGLPQINDPEHFRGWLLGIARNLSRQFWRGEHDRLPVAATPLVGGDPPQGVEASPLDRIISREDERVLWEAVRQLPEFYREPLVLFYREHQSLEKVAETLQISANKARWRLWRGRKMLHAQLVAFVDSALRKSRPPKEFHVAVVAAVAKLPAVAAVEPPKSAMPPGQVARVSHPRPVLVTAAVGTSLVLVAIGALRLARKEEPWDQRAARPERPVARRASTTQLPPPMARGPAPEAAEATGQEKLPSSPSRQPGTPLLRFDFEDGILPEAFSMGHVAEGPSRRGNQHAAMATVMSWFASPTPALMFTTKNLRYREAMVLHFDYWLGADGGDEISLVARNSDAQANYFRDLKGAVHERWAHAAIRLSSLARDCKPCTEAGGPMEPGDEIASMTLWGGRVGGSPFYVDNVSVVDYRTDQLSTFADGLDVSEAQ